MNRVSFKTTQPIAIAVGLIYEINGVAHIITRPSADETFMLVSLVDGVRWVDPLPVEQMEQELYESNARRITSTITVQPINN